MANRAKFGETNFGSGDLVRVFVRLIEQEKKGGKKLNSAREFKFLKGL